MANTFSKKVILLFYLVTIFLIGLVFFVGTRMNIPFNKITGDPALTFGENPLTGFLSNIGVLFWCATVAILAFSSVLAGKMNHKKEMLFLLSSGVITAILMLDDLFMVHDYLFYSIGWNQYVMYTIYLVLFILYFLYYFKFLRKLPFRFLLIAAFFFLGSSVGMDIIFETTNMEYFVEDSFKFTGIVSWFLFYVLNSLAFVKNLLFKEN